MTNEYKKCEYKAEVQNPISVLNILSRLQSTRVSNTKMKRNHERNPNRYICISKGIFIAIFHLYSVHSQHFLLQSYKNTTYDYITLCVSHFLGCLFPNIVQIVANIDTFLFWDHVDVVTFVHHFSARLWAGVTVAWRRWCCVGTHFCS